MAKPTELAPWATDNNYPAGAEPEAGTPTKVAYTLGQATVGWRPKGKPPAQELNTWMHRVGKWVAFVNEESHVSSVDFNLAANVDDADLTGTGTLENVHTVNVMSVGIDWNLNGIVGGVDRREVQLLNAGAFFFWLGHERAGSAAANRIAMPTHFADVGGFIRVYPGGSVRLRYDAAVSRWRVISTTGCRYRRTLLLSAASARPNTATEIYGAGQWLLDNETSLDYPIDLPAGAVLHGYTIYYDKTSSGAVTLASRLKSRRGSDGTLVSHGAGQTDNRAAIGFATQGEQDLELTTLETDAYFLEVSRSPDTSSADNLFHARVQYWDLLS